MTHRFTASLLGALTTLALIPAHAAVSADEAKALGTTLTEVGAIKAGNKEGTIPPYTGGLTQAPAGFKKDSGFWADPFKDEKPLLRIDAKNLDRHADKLSEGQKHLLRTNPGYYMDVYPTHRTAAFSERVIKATLRNATTCRTDKNQLAVDPACRGGLPFPIPKTGYEAMWNQLLHWVVETDFTTESNRTWVVDASGQATMTADQFTRSESPYWQVDQKDRDPQMYLRTYSVTKAPARKSGLMSMLVDFLDTESKPRRAYSYTPGQRRVKLAPEFSYDTPVSELGGATFFDELFLFSGKMDRFDFKLVGKQEMLIPYNNYKHYGDCKNELQFQPRHLNPVCERWELHRVWVVESTLKPGMRHAYAKRVYYFDEDLSGAGMFDAFDQSGKLYRSMNQMMIQWYDRPGPFSTKTVTYDFNKNQYLLIADTSVGGTLISPKALSEADQNPEAVVGRETVR